MDEPRRSPTDRFRGGEVSEQELPGIGRRYDLGNVDGGRLAVVIHHTGRRDLYVSADDDDDDDDPSVVSLSDAQARTLGAVLGGAYFKPAIVEEIDAVIGNLLIDWVTLRVDSPAVGHSIAELEIRQRTRMTIAAILRDHEALIAPEPTELLAAGDRLVVMGRPEDLRQFLAHVVGSGDG